MRVTHAVIRVDFANPFWEKSESGRMPLIGGLHLMERQILSLAKIGIQKIWIVIRPQDEFLRASLQKRVWPAAVAIVENPKAQQNDASWLATVSGLLDQPFLAVSADELCDKNFLKTFCESFDPSAPHAFAAKSGSVREVAVFSPVIFQETNTQNSFVALCEHLKQKNQICEKEIGAFYCEKLAHLADRAQVERILLQSCRKDTDGFISRHINRRISLFITSWLLSTPVHANFMTLITSLIGLASGYLAYVGSAQTYALAGFLFNLASILDGVDGELARIRLTDSKLGQWLDTLSDNGALVAFMGGTIWGLQKRADLAQPAWLVPAALIGLLMLFFVMVYFLLKYTESGSLVAIKQKLESLAGLNPVVAGVIRLNFLIRRDFFATVVMAVAFFDKPHWVIAGLAVATHVAWIFLLSLLVFGRRHLL